MKKGKLVVLALILIVLLFAGFGLYCLFENQLPAEEQIDLKKIVQQFSSSKVVEDLKKDGYRIQGYYVKATETIRINISKDKEKSGVIYQTNPKNGTLETSFYPEQALEKVATYALISSLTEDSEKNFRKLQFDLYDLYSLDREGIGFEIIAGKLKVKFSAVRKISLDQIDPQLVEG